MNPTITIDETQFRKLIYPLFCSFGQPLLHRYMAISQAESTVIFSDISKKFWSQLMNGNTYLLDDPKRSIETITKAEGIKFLRGQIPELFL